MKSSAYFGIRKTQYLCHFSCNKVNCFRKFCKASINSFFHGLKFQFNPFWIQLVYFLFLSLVGYLALKVSKPRADEKPKDFDIFFTSVSSATVSSMSTVEMEVFSNTQLIIMIILMFVGGEVFTSMLGLHFERFELHNPSKPTHNNSSELVSFSDSDLKNQKPETDLENNIMSLGTSDTLRISAMKSLSYIVMGYLLVVHIGGSSLVAMYANLVPSAKRVLTQKGIHIQTFAMFTTASTFVNCGFVPTNENMIVFKRNSGLLLLLIPQTLLGNTLYAPSLRFLIWVLEKFTKRVEYSYILRNRREMGYSHLLSGVHCWFLVMTVIGFIVLQFVVFCCLEWNSSLMDGLSLYEKFVAVLFQVVSTRHSGESVFDLSAISPAILVIFVVMMYFPPYTSYLPRKQDEEISISGKEISKNGKKTLVQCLLFSQLSYLVIFIILICVVEREKLKTDPLNFNVLNITIEVISAYGNVGYSTGYSCERQIKADSSCKDVWIGLVGKWSNLGKFILIIVMFLGRLKKFSMNNGGQAWNLS